MKPAINNGKQCAFFPQALHFNFLKLEDGSIVNQSVPIVLSIDDAQKEAIGSASAVTLIGPTGSPLAILRK